MNERITKLENEYANLWFYPEYGIIHHQFLQPMSDRHFKTTLMTGLELMREYRVVKWLSDDRANSITSADAGAWSQEYWLPRAYQAGWKYWAVLPPIKARGRINMERLVGYVGQQMKIEIEVFADPDDALQWLIKQPAS
ncbi:MAG: hypothetical protein P8163_18715 [Candidatus Thiodiazotropha sp.]